MTGQRHPHAKCTVRVLLSDSEEEVALVSVARKYVVFMRNTKGERYPPDVVIALTAVGFAAPYIRARTLGAPVQIFSHSCIMLSFKISKSLLLRFGIYILI